MELLLKPQVVAVPLFALMIALEAWYSVRKKAGEYERGDTWTNIFLGLVSLFFGAFLGLITEYFYTGLYNIAPYQMPMNVWWAWVLVLLADDFAYYWFHRISHESRLFWNFHVVHHSSEHFNLSVAVRQSWFGPLAHWVFYAPLGLLGFPFWSFVLIHGLNLIYQYWIHTPFIKNLGPLEYVLNTPSHHRVHHAVNPIYLDKNYAGVFIIWDRMFGSFVRETEPPRYGIIKPVKSFNWVWINTHAWFEMFSAIRSQKTLSGKLRCIFGSPNMDF